ncbi:hypothetical protein Tco_0111387 [Tanacetum coccineum]
MNFIPDPEQAQRDNDMHKNLASQIAMYFQETLQTTTKQPRTPRKHQKQECGYYYPGYKMTIRLVQNHDESNVYDNVRRHSEQPESINNTYVLEKDDSNVTPDSSNICTNDNQVDQNAAECVDERAALANLIANLTLDTEENKTILNQLKKANASLTQELEKCKTNVTPPKMCRSGNMSGGVTS